MQRVLAIIEREMRRFRRSPMLITMSLLMPLLQLVILGHAFGGTVKNLKVGIVDQDHGVPAVRLRELSNAIANNARTYELIPFTDPGDALQALRNGKVSGVLTIPPGFSRRVVKGEAPKVALIMDNTDNFATGTLSSSVSGMLRAYNASAPSTERIASQATLQLVEVYPFVPYIQYMLPGTIVMSIFMMVMIGGGIIYLDDKARGLHEGYLVTPISRFELILGFNISGAMKASLAGLVLMTLGSIVAGVPNAFEPARLLWLFVIVVTTSIALVSMMFLLMVRMKDALAARALFGVLNTMLYFPSGAVYPQAAFPGWLRTMAVADPFTYPVHALKSVVLKGAGFGAIAPDLLWLAVFSVVTMTAATLLFKREL
jgi:ABC-2 type transport system permease protein